MDLSRRGVLGGLGAACALGAVGFAGAARVTDGEALDGVGSDGPGPTAGGDGSEPTDDGDPEGAVAVDPDAPFVARLVDESAGDELTLFDAAALDEVAGVFSADGEHRVHVVLGDAAIEALRNRLASAGATDDPDSFVVSMTLDGTEVRRVELDATTVASLTDDEWSGVVTLPFGQEAVARSVYAELAAS